MNFYYDPILGLQYTYLPLVINLSIADHHYGSTTKSWEECLKLLENMGTMIIDSKRIEPCSIQTIKYITADFI